jgi:hypothetical protein
LPITISALPLRAADTATGSCGQRRDRLVDHVARGDDQGGQRSDDRDPLEQHPPCAERLADRLLVRRGPLAAADPPARDRRGVLEVELERQGCPHGRGVHPEFT